MVGTTKNRGFTLIEMSIVMVIIGLVIAAITVAQGMVKQANVRGAISEFTGLRTSITTFKLQFGYLPGDFNNAATIWPSATCPSGLFPTGCNGNGNGIVDAVGGINGYEFYRAFQHLSLAGYVNGTYNGTATQIDQYTSKYYAGGCYNLLSPGPTTFLALNNTSTSTLLELGTWEGYHCDAALIPTLDAYAIDTKLDDGNAKTGNLIGADGWYVSVGACSAGPSAVAGTGYYNLTTTGGVCTVRTVAD